VLTNIPSIYSQARSLYGSQTYLATGTTPSSIKKKQYTNKSITKTSILSHSEGLGSSRHLSSSTPQVGGTTPQQRFLKHFFNS
jgi:hypothetical protein